MLSWRKHSSLAGAVLLLTFICPLAKGQDGAQTSSAMYDPDLHLFVDNSGIERNWQMGRVLGRPEKRPEPIIMRDKPWETGSHREIFNYGGFGSVIYDPDYKKFRMWYADIPMVARSESSAPEFMCYAGSEDGIHWVKPSLGLIEYNNSKDNNIVFSHTSTPYPYFRFMVVRDEVEKDPAKRYKGIGWHNPGFFAVLYSPDGLHWSGLKDVSSTGGDTIGLTWDPIRKLYIMVGRGILTSKQRALAGGYARTLGIYESPNMDRWGFQGLGVDLDEEDGYGRIIQHWTMNPFVYGDQYLGLVNMWTMRGTGVAPSVELMSSRDGRAWQYVARRQSFFIFSPSGYWHGAANISLASGPPIPVSDDVYLYYTSRIPGSFSMGVAKVRRGRFAGLRSGEGELMEGDPHATTNKTLEPVWGNFHPPYALTKPIKITGPRLQVNLQTQGGGVLRVSLRQPFVDEKHPGGEPIPGYTSEECMPLSGDATRLEVHWKNHQDLSDLVGKEVSLTFELKDGTIWSYRFGH